MSDDTDDTTPNEVSESALASAYLDGEASPDERALVETSPEALEEVESLSQVRTVLAATAPIASLSERESHLAGALDVWERMSDLERSGEGTPAAGVDAAAAAAVLTPVSTSDGRRSRGPRSTKRGGSFSASQWLLGAAAALVVVAGGAAVVRGVLDNDRSTDNVALESAADDAPQLSEVEENEALEVDDGNVGTDVRVDPDFASEQAQENPDSDEGGLFDEENAADEDDAVSAGEAMEEDAAEDDATAAEESAPAEQPAPPPEIDLVQLETLDDLADYGLLAVRAAIPGTPEPDDIDAEPPLDSCEAVFGLEERLEPASYQGVNVSVGVDLDGGVVYAYTADDCELVETAPLPTPPTTEP